LKKSLKIALTFNLLFLITSNIFAQSYTYNIDYYGIVATEVDTNMSKMTSDLYYTQLCEIQNFNVLDKREVPTLSEKPASSLFAQDKLSFFTVISKAKNSDKWLATIHVYNKEQSKEFTKTKEYDSFYKILMESKQSLQETLKNLIENNSTNVAAASSDSVFDAPAKSINSEFLSGTWSGEEHIDKIIIMRGGRGFVIYKNGASMNIELQIKEDAGIQKVIISQKGKSNASFFPELPRNLALTAALSADPITWTLTIRNNDILIGEKSTLIASGDSYKPANTNVTWTRIN